MEKDEKVNSFLGLDVYKRAFAASKEIIFSLLPKLPSEEKYVLVDQMRRASKAIC
jgi:four helix bundle protein